MWFMDGYLESYSVPFQWNNTISTESGFMGIAAPATHGDNEGVHEQKKSHQVIYLLKI